MRRLWAFPMIRICSFFLLGIGAAYVWVPVLPTYSLWLLFLLLGMALGCHFLDNRMKLSAYWTGTSIYLFFLAFGFVWTGMQFPKNNPHHYTHRLTDGVQQFEGEVVEVWKSNKKNQRYIVELHDVDGHPVKGKLLLLQPRQLAKLSYGEQLVGLGRFRGFQKPMHPTVFDYGKFLQNKGVYAKIQLRDSVLVRSAGERLGILAYGLQLRTKLTARLASLSKNDAAFGVIKALFLGDKRDITSDIYSDYQDAGALHLLAISGLHIGILMLILRYVFAWVFWAWNKEYLELVSVLVVLWAYAVFTAWSPSVVRAVMMFSFVAIGLILRRPNNMYNTLAMALFFMLLLRPLWVVDVGFQMSFVAVLAIVTIMPVVKKYWDPVTRLGRRFRDWIAVGFAAQMGVLPISLFYFHQFPLLFVLTNVLVLPFLGMLLGYGFLVVVLASFQILPPFVYRGLEYAIVGLNNVIGWVAAMDAMVIRDIVWNMRHLLAAYLVLFCVVRLFHSWGYRPLKQLLIVGNLVFLSQLATKIWWKQQTQLWIVQEYGKSSLMYREGSQLQFYSASAPNAYLMEAYSLKHRIEAVTAHPLQNRYDYRGKCILRIGRSDVVNYPLGKVDVLWLTENAKVHLERLLKWYRPNLVVADGSNFPDVVERWRRSCEKAKLPFHNTAEMGALQIF
ncbi:MAG: ComEC family competence protein [Flavobacteriaceae bacterium]|nr:ComEC family competence protein [Flavobacteriaceae bacterium]